MTPAPLCNHLSLRERVLALAQILDHEASLRRADVDAVLPRHRASALNLAHYLGLRQHDVRELQLELAALGLSSLGRCEGHVRDTIAKLCAWLSGGGVPEVSRPTGVWPDSAAAERQLRANARALFGPRPKDRHVYIMVTAPAASDATAEWADSILDAGANLLRINAAHESVGQWASAVGIFRARAAALNVPVRIVVDLPGPKLRIEIRQLEPRVIHLPRRKDAQGRALAPTVVQLAAEATEKAHIPVPGAWLPKLEVADTLVLTDPSGRERELTVREAGGRVATAECRQSLYVIGGLPLSWHRGSKLLAEATVPSMPDVPRRVMLAEGDLLLLNVSGLSADPQQPTLAVPEPDLLAQVRSGERVILDDGRIVAVVEAQREDGLLCRVKATVKAPARLRSGKGIAFPDSHLEAQALGEEDDVALTFALDHADAVGVSFVNSAADVARVGERVRAADKPGFGMILKLETRGALTNLPSILFEALKYDPVGLMIARGDLAADVGFGRLAEMQEELLWFGEACHLPVIWATQVLESVAHSGLPTRAEVTDAAMSMRAECVMLNKGPYVATANRLLADIIRKMEAHQYKKRALFRPLAIAGSGPASTSAA